MTTRLIVLLALALLAFAGNSILNRAALAGGYIDPQTFAFVRVLSGAAFLCAVALLRKLQVVPKREDIPGIFALSLYMAGFSVAYTWLDAGLGALVLFGVVQITVIGWGISRGSNPTAAAVVGLAVAAIGLLWLLRPDPDGAPLFALVAMIAAGLGWGVYTVLGRGSSEPLGRTARNFVGAVPLLAPLIVFGGSEFSGMGIALAAASGIITSGAGYTLWYFVLPKLSPVTAGTSQLAVPPITAVLGAALLGELITLEIILASLVILGGVSLTFRGRKSQK